MFPVPSFLTFTVAPSPSSAIPSSPVIRQTYIYQILVPENKYQKRTVPTPSHHRSNSNNNSYYDNYINSNNGYNNSNNDTVVVTVQDLLNDSLKMEGLTVAHVSDVLVLILPRYGKKDRLVDAIIPNKELVLDGVDPTK